MDLELALPLDIETSVSQLDAFINEVEGICPEVAKNREQLAEIGGQILVAHAILPHFLDFEDNHIGLLMGAALQMEANRAGNKSERRREREAIVAKSFNHTLARRYVRGYEEPEHILAGAKKAQLLNELKDEELSEQISELLVERVPALYEVLGIDSVQDSFMPMEICALNISDHQSTETWKSFFEDIGLSYPYGPEEIERQIENGAIYLRSLGANSLAQLPKAATSHTDDAVYICVPAHWAQVVAHSSVTGNYLHQTDATASFDHEFIHAKGVLRHAEGHPGQEGTGHGRGLEEVRAEAFSGGDCERTYQSLGFVNRNIEKREGISVGTFMKDFTCGGVLNKPEFYLSLADRFGLWTAGMLTGLIPKEGINIFCGEEGHDTGLSEQVYDGSDILFTST